MTSLFQEAVEKVTALPEERQNALAAILLEEMEAELRWQESFARSTDALDKLADEALEEHRQGKTRDLREIL